MTALAFDDYSRDDWHRLTDDFDGLSLMQTWAFGAAKARSGPWRVERALLRDGTAAVGAVQALVRPLPAALPGGLAWINRGPLWRRRDADADPARLTAALAALRDHYGRRGLYLRVAPPLVEDDAAATAIAAAGLAPTGTAGWASAVLDLTRPLDDLRRALKSRWRGALRKGEAAALTVDIGTDGAPFEAFLAGHRALVEGRGLATSVTAALLADLQAALPAERRMTALVARHQGRVVGATLVCRYGDTAEYLAGNTDDEGRRLSAGQLLLWRAIAEMQAEGVARFDLGGMDPLRTPAGIFRFKDGLGGAPYRLVPEVEACGGLLGRLVRWRVNAARAAEAA